MPLGFEFQPSMARLMAKKLNSGAQAGPTSGTGSNPSEVLKILALHLPRILGGHPLTPLAMQPGPGGSAPGPITPGSSSPGVGPGGAPGGPEPSTGGLDPAGSPFAPPGPEPFSVGQFGGGAMPGAAKPSGAQAPNFLPGEGGGPRPFIPEEPAPRPGNLDPSYGVVQPNPLPVKGGASGPLPGGEVSKPYYANHPLAVMLEHFFPGGFKS